MDGVEEVLRCHRLRWNPHAGVVEQLNVAPVYGLVTDDIIRRIRHIVRAGMHGPFLTSSDERRGNHEIIREGEQGVM